MSCTARVQRRDEENGCLMIGDEKLVDKKVWTALEQRVDLFPDDYTFDIEVLQAMSGEKLPFIVRAAAVVFTVAPRTDDDIPSHLFNDLVRGVIERETRALAASMNHQEAVFEFENVELKKFDRLIVYVMPQSVDVFGNVGDFNVVAEDDGAGPTAKRKGEEDVQRCQPSNMGEIMGWACKSLKLLIHRAVYGSDDTTADQLKQQIKLLSSYSLKALWFAMPMFYTSLTHHYSTSTAFGVEDTLFLVAIITDAALILLLPKWGNALVCISWLLLELATCLLILSFNKHYAFAILAALLLVAVVALLQPKLQHAADKHVLPSFTQDMIGDDEESPHLGHLLDLSQGIASFGGLVTAIAGHFMVGPVNAVGFFFFCAIALGLYLSMVVTVGAVTRPHAKCLAIVVMVLVVLTFIVACIPFVGHSGSKPQVVT